MRPIVITQPCIASSSSGLMAEAEALAALAGLAPVVHIRKPDATKEQLAELLSALAETGVDMARFTLHYNIPMALRFGLGGVHVRRDGLARVREDMNRGQMPVLRVSASTHSWNEACEAVRLADYVFLSPLFDSISKPGYKSAVSLGETPSKLAAIEAALWGAVWNGGDAGGSGGTVTGGERSEEREERCSGAAAGGGLGEVADSGEQSEERGERCSGGFGEVAASGRTDAGEEEAVKSMNKIVALGGIDASNIGSVCHVGFGGAALLGAVWNGGGAGGSGGTADAGGFGGTVTGGAADSGERSEEREERHSGAVEGGRTDTGGVADSEERSEERGERCSGAAAGDRTDTGGEEAVRSMNKIVALGGIDASNIGSVYHAGFGGAALLGAVWNGGGASGSGGTAGGGFGEVADGGGFDFGGTVTGEERGERRSGAAADSDGFGEAAGGRTDTGEEEVGGSQASNCAENLSAATVVANYNACRRAWDVAQCHLQFISDGDMEIARKVLEGGGRWIQLRMKGASEEEIASRGRYMLELCRKYGAVMLINDNPRIAAEIDADGVHLGKNDMSPAEARMLLGSEAIIGSTANTLEDVIALGSEPIDYIGLGPYCFTTTKKNLSPVLGLDGYRHITEGMRRRGITLPVVAIGGICAEDVPEIMHTGVYGIAVSGGISAAADVEVGTRAFLNRIIRSG